jgi:hypothetical protein
MRRRIELSAVWSGAGMGVLTLVGMVIVGRFIPPFMDPSDTAAQVAAKYADRTDSVRIGLVIGTVGLTLILPFGIAIAARIRESEPGPPILTYVGLASTAVATVFVVLACAVWGIAAYRPGDLPAHDVRLANDAAYILFIFTYPPFSVWCVSIALAVFADERERPVFPRWIAYLNLWLALLIAAGALVIFFHTGAFAYNGLLSLYVPVTAFFVWVVAMTVVMLQPSG